MYIWLKCWLLLSAAVFSVCSVFNPRARDGYRCYLVVLVPNTSFCLLPWLPGNNLQKLGIFLVIFSIVMQILYSRLLLCLSCLLKMMFALFFNFYVSYCECVYMYMNFHTLSHNKRTWFANSLLIVWYFNFRDVV